VRDGVVVSSSPLVGKFVETARFPFGLYADRGPDPLDLAADDPTLFRNPEIQARSASE
jgi:hypothetical protein